MSESHRSTEVARAGRGDHEQGHPAPSIPIITKTDLVADCNLQTVRMNRQASEAWQVLQAVGLVRRRFHHMRGVRRDILPYGYDTVHASRDKAMRRAGSRPVDARERDRGPTSSVTWMRFYHARWKLDVPTIPHTLYSYTIRIYLSTITRELAI